jgi:carboxymethylenebutenolidase
MTQFNSYLTEEVVEDYSDGIIGRREALRRLGMLGVAAAVAVPMLAACDTGEGGGAQTATGSPAASAPAGPPAQPTESITFDGPGNRTLQGAWSAAAEPRGAVLVVHENRGLTDHIRSVAGRLATSGYSALAIDLL